MSLTVVKLGSTLVADEAGDVRTDVLREVCRQVGAIHGDGGATTLVTSGAIALGMRRMGMPVRPSAIEELQAASAVGQGPLYDVYADLLGEHDTGAAQVLLTFFDVSARDAVRECPPHAREAARVGRRADHQRERHHRHRRDHLRRQRHPRRAGRDPPVRRPAGRALRRGRAVHERPGARPGRRARVRRCATSRSCATTRSACPARTSAPAGCAARCCAPRWPRRPASRS